MSKTITRSQYYQLVGLRAAAEHQIAILKAMEAAAADITGERGADGYSDHTVDYLWGSRDIDELLQLVKVEVRDEPAREQAEPVHE